jgi:hypothetical protein
MNAKKLERITLDPEIMGGLRSRLLRGFHQLLHPGAERRKASVGKPL